MLGNHSALWLLFLVPTVILPMMTWSAVRKRQALRRLAHHATLARLIPSASPTRQAVKAALVVLGFVCIVIALTEPKWNPRPEPIRRRGRDVCILLDTSRSMLAEDISPTRLQRSLLAIQDLLEVLQGDRIAIVTFAGNATIKCPLTQDYSFVRMMLADITTESNSRGGTLIGDAIRKATREVFDPNSRQYKDIILITDGEDHDSYPEEAAKKAAEEGIRIIAIGLGDESEGSRIPITDANGVRTFLTFQGREVWSKLDGDTLRAVAAATEGGRYLAVRPGMTLDLGQVYLDLIASAEKRDLESLTLTRYDEKFQIFLGLAVLLLVTEIFVSERRGQPGRSRRDAARG